MPGWNEGMIMSSALYRYEYEKNLFAQMSSPSDLYPRAEDAIVWIPAGTSGLLVYFDGIVNKNGAEVAKSLDNIMVYDPASNKWFTQTATGVIPQNRKRFCADVAWASDFSSYNMRVLVYAGKSFP